MFYVMLRAGEPANLDSKVAIYEGQYGDNFQVAYDWLRLYGGEEPRKLNIPQEYCHWIDDVIGDVQYIAGNYALIGYSGEG